VTGTIRITVRLSTAYSTVCQVRLSNAGHDRDCAERQPDQQ